MLVYLLPPSEGKQEGGDAAKEQTTFSFPKPLSLAADATPKDLKCSGARYEEGIALNKCVEQGPWMPAIERYSGVMFNAIGYQTLDIDSQQYFDRHIMIMSGMYGWVAPQDSIANYKLPIDTKGLKQRRSNQLTDTLTRIDKAIFVDLLPNAHKKMLDFGCLDSVVHVDFFKDGKKMSHGVKGVKGHRLRERCLEQSVDPENRPKTMSYKGSTITLHYF